MRVCYIKFAGYTGVYVVPVCSYVESNYVLDVDDDTTSAVLPRRRGAHEKTCGIRNRRRNVYASHEVWMLWLSCLSITTVHGACDRPRCLRVVDSGIHAPHPLDLRGVISLPNHLSSITSSISSPSDLAASVLSLLLSKTKQFDHILCDSRRIPGRGNYVFEF